ncbi:MAG: hypothetical protein MnENMB40S_08130 [Rhizobiaceae bacterium MnEN-MB40S]|nr:MAG: hypothetical protein MnENMB40S_08130 [Rhizobiaceae bacterium MnEN-MB40S]
MSCIRFGVMILTSPIIMLAFVLGVYSNKTLNPAIFIGAVIVFATSPWLVRSQVAKSDPSYMRAMIPHHSIAVMTSQRAQTKDAVEDALNNSPMSTLDPSPITAEEAVEIVTVQSCHMVYT